MTIGMEHNLHDAPKISFRRLQQTQMGRTKGHGPLKNALCLISYYISVHHSITDIDFGESLIFCLGLKHKYDFSEDLISISRFLAKRISTWKVTLTSKLSPLEQYSTVYEARTNSLYLPNATVLCTPWQQEHYRIIFLLWTWTAAEQPPAMIVTSLSWEALANSGETVVLMFCNRSDSSRTRRCPSQLASRWSDCWTTWRAVLLPGAPSAIPRFHRTLHP